jgi:hypothetical protein
MGQFLATGLITRTGILKEDLLNKKISVDEIKLAMDDRFSYSPEIYDIKEDEKYYTIELKSSIIDEQLMPFLKKFYSCYYENDSINKLIIEKISPMNSIELMRFAKTKPYEQFQMDSQGIMDPLLVGLRRMSISSESLILSITGKIWMECYFDQFKFFQYTIMETFKEFSIAGAIRIYITG